MRSVIKQTQIIESERNKELDRLRYQETKIEMDREVVTLEAEYETLNLWIEEFQKFDHGVDLIAACNGGEDVINSLISSAKRMKHSIETVKRIQVDRETLRKKRAAVDKVPFWEHELEEIDKE